MHITWIHLRNNKEENSVEQCLFYDAYIKYKICKVILCIMAVNTEKIK